MSKNGAFGTILAPFKGFNRFRQSCLKALIMPIAFTLVTVYWRKVCKTAAPSSPAIEDIE
jgi:hypothetical protein